MPPLEPTNVTHESTVNLHPEASEMDRTASTAQPTSREPQSPPTLHPQLRKIAYFLAIIGPGFASLMLLIVIGWQLVNNDRLLDILLVEHTRATLGLPAVTASSYATILSFQATSGPIRFKGLGFEFEGASGPAALFILIFLAEIIGLVVLWG